MIGFRIADALGAGYTSAEIIDHLKANPQDADGFKIADALQAGYSPDEIVDHLNPRADKINVQGIPVLAPIDRGIAHLREQGANLATDLGAPGVGSFIRQSIPQATLHATTSGAKLSEDLGNRNYLGALSNLPSAALEQAVPVAGGVAAGMASGGSVPAALAAGGAIGAVSQGDAIARQRAANNGRSDPSASDLALGLAGGAGVGAVGSLGLGGIAGRGVAGAVRGTLLHGAADAAQPELASLAGSVGTTAGAQNASAQDMAAAGLTGLATRGAIGAPGMVRDMTPSGQRSMLADQYANLPPAAQAALSRTAAAGAMLASTRADVVPGLSEPTQTAISRTAGDLLDSKVQSLAAHLDIQGELPDGGLDTIHEAQQAAAAPGRVLTNQHLQAIDGLGLDPQTAQTFKDVLQERDLVSRSGEPAPMPGVAGAAGRAVKGIAGAVLPPIVTRMAGAALGPFGEAIVSRFGLTDPPLIKAAANATDMLQAAGQPIPDTMGRLQDAMAQSRDVVAAQRRLMDLEAQKQGAAKAAEADAAQRFKLDYGDAQYMNRGFDRNANFQRAQEVGDAQSIDRARTQALNFQRSQEVASATTENAMRDRGTNLLEAQGGNVAMMAYNRMLAAKGLSGTPTVDAARNAPTPPDAPPGPQAPTPPAQALNIPVETIAAGRAASRAPGAVGGLEDLTAPMPGLDGVNAVAKAQGALLPEWQYGLGNDLLNALSLRGQAKNLNIAQEVRTAVEAMRDRGWFDGHFSDALMAHGGRVTRGLYNVIRNEMLGNHGIDMRTLDAQVGGPTA